MAGCVVAGCCAPAAVQGTPAGLQPASRLGRPPGIDAAARGRAWLAVAAMLAAVTLWGPSFVATKVALRDLPPLTVAFLRFLVASCVLYTMWRLSPEATRLDRATHRRLFAGGLLGVAGYFILENLGVQRTTAGDAALLMAAIPVIALLAEALWLKQPVSLTRGAGIAVSFAGVVLLIGRAHATGGSHRVPGDLVVVAAAFLWAAYSLHGKTVTHVPKLTVVTYEAIYGTLLLAPAALIESPHWRPVPPGTALAVAYLGVMCSAVTYLLYNYALKTLAASQVTAFLNLVPVAGAAAAALLLGEHLQPAQLLGGAIILAGVAITTAGNTRAKSAIVAARPAGACKSRTGRPAQHERATAESRKSPGPPEPRTGVKHAMPSVREHPAQRGPPGPRTPGPNRLMNWAGEKPAARRRITCGDSAVVGGELTPLLECRPELRPAAVDADLRSRHRHADAAAHRRLLGQPVGPGPGVGQLSTQTAPGRLATDRS